MALTAFDVRENMYALILASLKDKTPEQAFIELEGSQEMASKLKQEGYKICRKCGVAKPLDQFYSAQYEYQGEIRYSARQPCKECYKEKYRKKKAGTE